VSGGDCGLLLHQYRYGRLFGGNPYQIMAIAIPLLGVNTLDFETPPPYRGVTCFYVISVPGLSCLVYNHTTFPWWETIL
jgi:hypothetical protein